jgi:hypothetical protein
MLGQAAFVGQLLSEGGGAGTPTTPKFPGSAIIYRRGASASSPVGSVELTAYKSRTEDYVMAIYAADVTSGIALAEDDEIRVKIGRADGSVPVLELSSADVTDDGSAVTITNQDSPAAATLRLAQADLATITAGPYEIEVMLVDSAELLPANAIKRILTGVLHVIGSLGGDVGR